MAEAPGHFDILVVGGGVIGLAIARELRRRGSSQIAVVDSGRLGRESSFAAAGMLTPQAESNLEDTFFQFCIESNACFPDLASELLEETGIDIELDRSGTLSLAFDADSAHDLRERCARQRSAGLRVESLTAEEVLDIEPAASKDVLGGLLFGDDGQVDNRRLVKALAKFALSNSIKIIQGCRVNEMLTSGTRAIGVETDRGPIHADITIIASGAWTSSIQIAGRPVAPVRPIRGQMMSFGASRRVFGHVIYGRGAYLVPRADGRILVGATVEDVGFDKGVTPEAIEQLRLGAIGTVPSMRDLAITETWAGLRPYSPDGLPVLGNIDGVDGLYIATGHFRNGILLAPLTARLIADSILENRKSVYLEEFRPGRFRPAAATGHL